MATGVNPFETPRPRGVPLMQGALRVIVAGYCFGAAASRLHQGRLDPLVSFLFPMEEGAGSQLGTMSDMVAYGLLVIGALTLLRPVHLLLLGVVVHAAGTAVAGMFPEDVPWSAWTPVYLATTWIAPIALLLMDFWPPRMKSSLVICLSSVGLLRLASVATFLSLGLFCLEQCQQGGSWVNLLQSAAQNGFHERLSDEESRKLLGYCSGIHFAVAAAMLTSRAGAVPVLAALWGVLWTMLPLFSEGQKGYDQSLFAISQWGAPLVVAIFQNYSIRRHAPDYIPEQNPPVAKKT